MGWWERARDWDRRALTPDIRATGGAWPILFAVSVLMLVVAVMCATVGSWVLALATATVAVLAGLSGWSARAQWRRHR